MCGTVQSVRISSVEAANKKYEGMSRAQRKVAVAKDVIAWINAGIFKRIKAANGYCERNYNDKAPLELTQETAQKVAQTCSVCARGAMMVVKIGKLNKFEYDIDYGGIEQQDTSDVLNDAFSDKELALIECAFEKGNWPMVQLLEEENPDYYDDEKVQEDINVMSQIGEIAAKFGKAFRSDADRLLAIMQNVVDHKGTFRPDVAYEITYQ